MNPVALADSEIETISSGVDALRAGKIVQFAGEAGVQLAANLFDDSACKRILADSSVDTVPVILLASVEHLDVMAVSLSADARVAIRRLMPGACALAVRVTGIVPAHAQMEDGLTAMSVPGDSIPIALLKGLGVPLFTVYTPGSVGPTIVDVTRRPPELIREGFKPLSELERYIPVMSK